MSGCKNVDKDQLDIKRRQMIDSFVQVGQALRTCADTVQAFADASALANPSEISSLLSILAAGHSLKGHGGDDDDGKKKRKRSLKDPNAPKRPVTAYLQFQNEVKNEVQDLHRDKAYKDILRLVAEKWKGLDDEVKQMYTDRHKRDMLVYEQRVQAYKNAIAEGRIPTSAATAFADFKEDDDENEDDEVASQVVGEDAESDESDDSDDEPKAPSPPPAKKSKPASKSKKAADEVPSSTPAGAEKRKSKKKASE